MSICNMANGYSYVVGELGYSLVTYIVAVFAVNARSKTKKNLICMMVKNVWNGDRRSLHSFCFI